MDFSVKVVMVGAEGVGKTCLLGLLAGESFEYGYHPTIGADLRVIRNEGMKVCIWDLAGSEKFSSILDGFIKTANIIIFCYTSGDSKSFEKAIQYYNQYKNIPVKKILVATKTDMHRDESYPYENQFGIDFVKTSALRRKGRDALMRCILSSYMLPEVLEEEPEETYKYKKYCCIC